jgi:glycosyltransferase involved in cell wall biosynthesis
MSKVIMLLSNPFEPDVRVHKEAKALVENGYDVEIIAWDRNRQYAKREVVGNIEVNRFQRIAEYGTFLSTGLNLFLFNLYLFLILLRKEFDIIHCNDFDTLMSGTLAGKVKNKKVVYDAHELYAEAVANVTPPFIVRLLKRIDAYLIRHVDAVICVSESQARLFRKHGPKKLETVLNCPEIVNVDSVRISDLRQKLDPDNSKMIVLYIGAFHHQRMLVELTELFLNIEDDFILVIGGFGTLEEKIRSSVSKNIRYLGKVDPDVAIAYNNAADVLVAMYDPKNKNNRIGLPNKLFEAMTAGKPVLVSKGSHAGEIVTAEKCGIAVEYGNKEEMLRVLKKLKSDRAFYDSLSKNGREAARNRYNWGIMKSKLLIIYGNLPSSK